MKKLTLLLSLAMLSLGLHAQTWTLDKYHSRLGFEITHLLVNDVDGSFKNFDINLTAAKADFSDAQIELTAQTTSVFTDNEKRDEHLRSADFFDVEKNPTMVFKSKKMTKTGTNKYKLAGELTMHGITKPVTLDVQYRGTITHPMTKKLVSGFKVTGVIKRSDFHLGDSYGNAVLSNEVNLTANVEFVKG